MTTISDVRKAISAAVNGVVKSTPYVTDQVNAPQATVARGDIVYDDTFDGTAAYEYIVTVYVARTNVVQAQEYLDELAEPSGTTSLKVALESHSGLRALVDFAVVTGSSPPRDAAVGDVLYLAADFTVKAVR